MSICTKFGETVVDVKVDGMCYYDGELVQIRAKVEGEQTERLIYISDLREDRKNEIRDVVRSAVKAAHKILGRDSEAS